MRGSLACAHDVAVPRSGDAVGDQGHSCEALPPSEGSLPSERSDHVEGGTVITGKAREREVRLMGFGLAALAVLAAALAIWVASAIGDHLHMPASSGVSVTQGASGG